jgi:hypothetical protein
VAGAYNTMSFELSLDSPLTAILLVGIGAFALFVSWRYSRIAAQTPSWIQVHAVILRARAKESGDGYVPDIAYRYTIDGKEYESSQVSIFFVYSTSLEGVRRKAHRYVATQQVIAYVNPTDHSQAVLVPGPQNVEALVFAAAGLLFMAAGAYAAVAYVTGSGD